MGQDTMTALIRLASQAMEAQTSNRNPLTEPYTKRDKLPSEYWKGTVDVLLGLTQTSDEGDLTPLWKNFANCEKREQRMVLQTALTRMSRALRLPSPVATVELTNMLVRLEFASTCVDHLDQGIQPFVVTYLDQKTVGEQKELIETHEQMVDGAPTLSDLLNLKAAAKLPLPTQEKQCKKTLESYAVLLAVMLGVTHPVFITYRAALVDDFDTVSTILEEAQLERPSDLPYVQYLRAIQLDMNAYWSVAQQGREAARPDFGLLHREILRRTWVGPPVPAAYLAAARPPPSRSHFSDDVSPSPSGGGHVPGKGGDPPKEPRRHQKNLKAAPALLERGANLGPINAFLKRAGGGTLAPIPTLKSPHPPCLAWHLRGGCYSDCNRKTGHCLLGDADVATLCQFVDNGLSKGGGSDSEKKGAKE
jgi:hypothetical protein